MGLNGKEMGGDGKKRVSKEGEMGLEGVNEG